MNFCSHTLTVIGAYFGGRSIEKERKDNAKAVVNNTKVNLVR